MGSTATEDQALELVRPILAAGPRATRARARRTTESVLLQDLGSSLPISQRTLRSLDKISILRLAVTQLKFRQLFGGGRTAVAGRPKSEVWPGWAPEDYALENLIAGGFLIVMSATGDVVYVSETISDSLGLRSWEVMGKNIYDYALPEDHTDVDQLLAFEYDGGGATNYPSPRTGLVRLKSTLRTQDNPVYFRPTSNKVIYFSGKMYLKSPDFGFNSATGSAGDPSTWPCFIGVGRTIPHPADHDYPLPTLSSRTYVSYCSVTNLTFLNVDKGLERLLGFSSLELMNKTGFDLYHVEDVPAMIPRFKSLFKQGQSYFEPYRFLAKGGGWVWMIAEASTIYKNSYRANNQRTSKSSTVVCRTIALSDVETKEIVSIAQLPDPSDAKADAAESCDCKECRSGSMSDSSSCSPAAATPRSNADLFEELLQSGSASDSSPDIAVDWDDSIEEFSKYVPPSLAQMPLSASPTVTPLSLPLKGKPLDDLYTDLSALAGDVDFTTLPVFTQALDALFVQEEEQSIATADDYGYHRSSGSESSASGSGNGYISAISSGSEGVAQVPLPQDRKRWTIDKAFLETLIGGQEDYDLGLRLEPDAPGSNSQIQSVEGHNQSSININAKKMKVQNWPPQ